MVFSGSDNSPQERLPGARQAPLKRKRSLSQFYCAKSQSFNCISDLLKASAFSKSSLMLAKRSSSTSGYRQPSSFDSISEDMSESISPRMAPSAAVSVPAATQLQSPFAAGCCFERHSWDGTNCCGCSPDFFGPLHGSLSATCEQHQQGHSNRPRVSHQRDAGASLQSSRSSSIVAAPEAEEPCWCAMELSAADSLCMALHTASLTSAAAAPQGFIGIGQRYGLSHEFQAAVQSNV